MENINIEKTSKTPEVVFNADTHCLEIKGISIPEDAENFYRPLMEWIEEYIVHVNIERRADKTETKQEGEIETEQEPKGEQEIEQEPKGEQETEQELEEEQQQSNTPNIVIGLKLIYFNTSTADYIVNILRKLREVQLDYPLVLDNASFNPDDAPPHWVTVEWYYEVEDEDMLDTGTHFESVLEMPFTYIAVDEIA